VALEVECDSSAEEEEVVTRPRTIRIKRVRALFDGKKEEEEEAPLQISQLLSLSLSLVISSLSILTTIEVFNNDRVEDS
jgi:hypothetical protein